MTIEQISVFLENRAGQLAEITGILANAGIDLRAIHIAETLDYGVLRMIASDTKTAAAVLADKGLLVSVTPVVAVAVDDTPGSLNRVMEVITAAGVDVSYMYSSFGENDGVAYMIFRVQDVDALHQALAAAGIPAAEPAQLGIKG